MASSTESEKSVLRDGSTCTRIDGGGLVNVHTI